MIEAQRNSGATPADTSDYIGGIAKELRAMAAKANLGFVAYLLAMVADEAEATTRRLRDEADRANEPQSTMETRPPV
jgi:hypothetical protein